MLAGAGLGAAAGLIMHFSGMTRERSGAAVVLVAIAAFYPAFAFALGSPAEGMAHLVLMGGWLASRRMRGI